MNVLSERLIDILSIFFMNPASSPRWRICLGQKQWMALAMYHIKRMLNSTGGVLILQQDESLPLHILPLWKKCYVNYQWYSNFVLKCFCTLLFKKCPCALVKYVVTVISILNEYTLRPSLHLIRSNGVEMRIIYILNN